MPLSLIFYFFTERNKSDLLLFVNKGDNIFDDQIFGQFMSPNLMFNSR